MARQSRRDASVSKSKSRVSRSPSKKANSKVKKQLTIQIPVLEQQPNGTSKTRTRSLSKAKSPTRQANKRKAASKSAKSNFIVENGVPSPITQSNIENPERRLSQDIAKEETFYSIIRSVLLLGSFCIGLIVVYWIIAQVLNYRFINLLLKNPDGSLVVSFPSSFGLSLERLKSMAQELQIYKDSHYPQIIFEFCVSFIVLQSFAIPGSMALSVLGGFLFGVPLAVLLISLCTALGSTCMYSWSYLFGSGFLLSKKTFGKYQIMAEKYQDHLFNYVFFLRVTPVVPNWITTLICPHIGIPVDTFFLATMLGSIPANWVYTQAGIALRQLTDLNYYTFFTAGNAMIICSAAIASILPIVLKERWKME